MLSNLCLGWVDKPTRNLSRCPRNVQDEELLLIVLYKARLPDLTWDINELRIKESISKGNHGKLPSLELNFIDQAVKLV